MEPKAEAKTRSPRVCGFVLPAKFRCKYYSGISRIPGACDTLRLPTARPPPTILMYFHSLTTCHLVLSNLQYQRIGITATSINTSAAMNKIVAAISLDRVALAAVTLASTLTIGEAYTRTSLVDADSAKEARYPPLSSIITEGELMKEAFVST